MASHHDEDTMPEETQGYKLSQPKQSLAEYQQMGMSINTFQLPPARKEYTINGQRTNLSENKCVFNGGCPNPIARSKCFVTCNLGSQRCCPFGKPTRLLRSPPSQPFSLEHHRLQHKIIFILAPHSSPLAAAFSWELASPPPCAASLGRSTLAPSRGPWRERVSLGCRAPTLAPPSCFSRARQTTERCDLA